MSVSPAKQAIFTALGTNWKDQNKEDLSTLLREKSLTKAIQNTFKNTDLKELSIHELRLISYANEIESKNGLLIASAVAIIALGFFSAFVGAEVAHSSLLSIIFGSCGGGFAIGAFAIYNFLYKRDQQLKKEAEHLIALKNNPDLTPLAYERKCIMRKLGSDAANTIAYTGVTKAIKKIYKEVPFKELSKFELRLISAVYQNEAHLSLMLISVLAFLSIGLFSELIPSQLIHNQMVSIICSSLGGFFALAALAAYKFLYRKEKEVQFQAEQELQKNPTLVANLALLRSQLEAPNDGFNENNPANYPASIGEITNRAEESDPSREDFQKWHDYHENEANRIVRINYFLAWFGGIFALSTLFCMLYNPTLSDIVPQITISGLCTLFIFGNYAFRIYPARKEQENFRRLLNP